MLLLKMLIRVIAAMHAYQLLHKWPAKPAHTLKWISNREKTSRI